MNTDLPTFYLRLLTGFLASPFGIAAIMGAVVLAVCAVALPSTRWALVCVAVWASTLPINTVGMSEGDVYVPLAFPLEQIRVYARPITLVMFAMLLLPLLTSTRGWRRHLIGWPLGLFFFFQIALSLRLTAGDIGGRGPLNLFSYSLLMLTFGVAVSMWLQTLEDVYKLLYAITTAAGLVIASTCYQLAINRAPIMSGPRLAGMTGNPQYLGLIVAFSTPAAAFLVTHGRRALKPLFAVQIAVAIVLLLWTGSRTGTLGLIAGLAILFWRQLGRLIVAGSVVAVLVYFALPLFSGSSEQAARLLSVENTRAGVYAGLMATISQHLWFGIAVGEIGVNENSYLSTIAQFGLVGFVPFIAAFCAMGYRLVRLQMQRSLLGEHQALADLVTGVLGVDRTDGRVRGLPARRAGVRHAAGLPVLGHHRVPGRLHQRRGRGPAPARRGLRRPVAGRGLTGQVAVEAPPRPDVGRKAFGQRA